MAESDEVKLHKLELLKEESRQLRGTIVDELSNASDQFSADACQLLKHHGSYQQDNRDLRKAKNPDGTRKGKTYSCMVRTRVPGGKVTAEQFLAELDLGDRCGEGTLRITSRQGLQLHGVLKENLRETIREINRIKLTTFAACGDVERNVMCCPAPYRNNAVRDQMQEMADRVAEHLKPKTTAYADRKVARMKYLIANRGIDWFKGKVEEYFGSPLPEPHPADVTDVDDHLGWHEQGDGRLFLGVNIENGRIKDEGDVRIKSGLRAVLERFGMDTRLTALQSVILCDIKPSDREEIDSRLADHGIRPAGELSLIRRYSMACPASPAPWHVTKQNEPTAKASATSATAWGKRRCCPKRRPKRQSSSVRRSKAPDAPLSGIVWPIAVRPRLRLDTPYGTEKIKR